MQENYKEMETRKNTFEREFRGSKVSTAVKKKRQH